jgi:hypothetical protein
MCVSHMFKGHMSILYVGCMKFLSFRLYIYIYIYIYIYLRVNQVCQFNRDTLEIVV